MGKSFSTGLLTNGIAQDSSNNIGIGGAVNASYKLTVTGTTITTGAATFSSSVTANNISTSYSGLASYNSFGNNIFIQPNGANNSFIADNIYYSSGFKLANAGAGAMVYFGASAAGSIDFRTAPTGSSGGTPTITTRMTILEGGNVGIGTSSPDYKLTINGGPVKVTDGTREIFVNPAADFGGGSNPAIQVVTNHALQFATNNTERMRITSDGNLYFNTSYTGYRVIIGGASGIRNVIMTNADSEGYAGGTTAMYVGKNSSTNRSINAAGTVNASGADYAEYMVKLNNNITFAKGDIVGVDANGLLTNIFADSKSFVIKSTNPSYVGGDSWFTEMKPEKTPEETDEEYAQAVAKWEARYQEARKTIDRIAFSGQVPCNVYNAQVGDYIIPVEVDGKITGQAISNPTFEQYQISVGKVWKIMEDGRAWVAVKIG